LNFIMNIVGKHGIQTSMRASFVLPVVGLLALMVSENQAAAQVAATCSFQSTTATLFVTIGSGDNAAPGTLSVAPSGAIRLDGTPCEEATVNNTDLIDVDGGGVLVLNNPSRFVPGLTPEATGTSEIEIKVDGSIPRVDVNLTPSADTLTLSTYNNEGGIDIANDGDQDVRFISGFTQVHIWAKGGNDLIDASQYCWNCAWLRVHGGGGSDTILGAHVAYGEGGNDKLYGATLYSTTFVGGPGNDLMVGGPFNDTFDQGSAADGADTIEGGGGVDEVDYRLRTNPITATLGNGAADDGEVGEGDNIDGNVERVFGGEGDDTLVGSTAANRLYGGLGNDEIYGGGGADYLSGGPGTDFLDGGPGPDDLFGDDGNDILDGGTGGDSIWGGAGNDELHDAGGSDEFNGGSGDDLIFNVDGVADVVGCGPGNDTVEYEAVDTFGSDCELP
jgi:Ca2+-binding RTX toxin-like protein